jgi:chaperonin cofactor prefoldin
MDARAEHLSVHEHTLRQQAFEIESALKELAGSTKTYIFVGGLLVEKPIDELRTDLTRRHESITVRLAELERVRNK